MKGYSGWSYDPYKPPLRDIGDIYVNRVVPGEDSVHFEWNSAGNVEYSVYLRVRGEGEFALVGKTSATVYDITGLCIDTDYEFYVEADGKKSRVRLARCGKTIGTVINYLHPDDEAYSFSGRYLCSPSLLRHPDGYLLSSMDLFAGDHPQNLTLIFRSDDDGKTWYHYSELMPCFWGKMFMHDGDVYMLAVSTEYGDLLIGRSCDGGKTFGTPVTLLRGSNGKHGNDGVHKNPQNVFIHNGRIYETLEWGTWANTVYCHAAMVMSCDINDDLLIPENWSFTEPVIFDPNYPEFEGMTPCTMQIEGTITASPDGHLYNIMRFGKDGYAIVYEIDTVDHEAPLRYSHIMPFEANRVKFMIKRDEVSGRYYTIGTRIYDTNKQGTRNLLSFMVSDDLNKWDVVCDLFDYRNIEDGKIGFQYVDFSIEGDDIIFQCRTAFNNAHNYHDSNYATFHRIRNFRDADSMRLE
nr:exo-alpha-sialidase [Clostridia bacterium]